MSNKFFHLFSVAEKSPTLYSSGSSSSFSSSFSSSSKGDGGSIKGDGDEDGGGGRKRRKRKKRMEKQAAEDMAIDPLYQLPSTPSEISARVTPSSSEDELTKGKKTFFWGIKSWKLNILYTNHHLFIFLYT